MNNSGIIYLIKFVVVSLISTGTLVTLALLPFVTQMGFNPGLIVIIVTTSVNVWLLTYMNAPFLTGSAAVQDGMASRMSMVKSSIGYMVINIVGLLVCVPVWKMMGIA